MNLLEYIEDSCPFSYVFESEQEPTIQDVYRMGRRYSDMFKPYFTDKNLFELFRSKCLEFANLFSDKTGAAGKHHNFLGGLAVHTFEMLDILYNTYVKHPENAKKFNSSKKKDNDKFRWEICAVAILYHDWGKLKEYDHKKGSDKNGRWSITYAMMSHGHIFMSAEQFDIDAGRFGVDEFLKESITHAILAHHSKREWGSPVTPMTPEAKIVCACDLISAERAKGKKDYFNQFLKGELNYDNYEEFYMNNVVPRLQGQQVKFRKASGKLPNPGENVLLKPISRTGWELDTVQAFLMDDKKTWMVSDGTELDVDPDDKWALIV